MIKDPSSPGANSTSSKSSHLGSDSISPNAVAKTPGVSAGIAFKHHGRMGQYSNCPPPSASATFPSGFRFVTNDITQPKNFEVKAILEPDVFIGKPDDFCCTGYGLSLYVDLASLRDKAKRTLRSVPHFLKKVGNHYACVALAPASGRCTAANGSGHFTLFEYENFDPV